MDWITFIKDNSQVLFTLSGVFLGSAITLLGNLLNNRFQARESDKDRLEKRREAKSQLAIDLIRNDIKRIEDVSDLMFGFINEMKLLNLKRDTGKLTSKEWLEELQAKTTNENSVIAKLAELDTTTDMLVYIHGEEIYSIYNDFKDLFTEYLNILSNPSSNDEDIENAYDKLIAGGAKFQQILRAKLISARDSV
jgi:hypothetical protein